MGNGNSKNQTKFCVFSSQVTKIDKFLPFNNDFVNLESNMG